jgi:hypothetical protein
VATSTFALQTKTGYKLLLEFATTGDPQSALSWVIEQLASGKYQPLNTRSLMETTLLTSSGVRVNVHIMGSGSLASLAAILKELGTGDYTLVRQRSLT